MAQPTTNAGWLAHWEKIKYEISLTGQEYSVPGAQSHKLVDIKFVEQQIQYYTDKIIEESYGYNGRQVIL